MLNYQRVDLALQRGKPKILFVLMDKFSFLANLVELFTILFAIRFSF